MLDFLQKLWSILNKQQTSGLNFANIFSYEIISNFYFEICSLYSILFYNPSLLVKNNSTQTKILLDMIENFSFTYTALNVADDSSQLIVVRLNFLNNVLNNENLFDICIKNMPNFEQKVVCFIIFAFLNTGGANSNKEPGDSNGQGKTTSSNHTERELQTLVKISVEKIKAFSELNIAFNTNLEEFLVTFVKKFSLKYKNIQVRLTHFLIKILVFFCNQLNSLNF